MSKFAKVRIATMIWGGGVMYLFTGDLGITTKMGLLLFGGNTLIMYLCLKK